MYNCDSQADYSLRYKVHKGHSFIKKKKYPKAYAERWVEQEGPPVMQHSKNRTL